MIVTQFDGTNAQVVIDLVQIKAIRAVLQDIHLEQYMKASGLLKIDNHPVSGDDVRSLCNQFVVTTRKLCSLKETIPTETPEDDQPTEAKPN